MSETIRWAGAASLRVSPASSTIVTATARGAGGRQAAPLASSAAARRAAAARLTRVAITGEDPRDLRFEVGPRGFVAPPFLRRRLPVRAEILRVQLGDPIDQ